MKKGREPNQLIYTVSHILNEIDLEYYRFDIQTCAVDITHFGQLWVRLRA